MRLTVPAIAALAWWGTCAWAEEPDPPPAGDEVGDDAPADDASDDDVPVDDTSEDDTSADDTSDDADSSDDGAAADDADDSDAAADSGDDGALAFDGVVGTWAVDDDFGDFTFDSASGSFAGFRVEKSLFTGQGVTAVGRTGVVHLGDPWVVEDRQRLSLRFEALDHVTRLQA